MDVGLKVNQINNGQVYLNYVQSLELVMERYSEKNSHDRNNGLTDDTSEDCDRIWDQGPIQNFSHQGQYFAPFGRRNGFVNADSRNMVQTKSS